MKVINGLIKHFDFTVPIDILGIHDCGNLLRNFIVGEVSVEPLHRIDSFFRRLFELGNAILVNAFDQARPSRAFQQIDRGLKGDKLAHLRHVDAVTIRITNLGCC
ncbi:MAG TPA: hypothetical protein DDW68_09985 [Verrucomicrobiales bacterium]|nr:hypothetical protein [Verrucomicrobiales bacterium]